MANWVRKSAISVAGGGWAIAFVAICAAAALAPSIPALMPYAHGDSGAYLYTGSRLLLGEIPYRDVWDHKPPLIYFIDALGLLLGNGSTWGVWILEFLAVAVALGLGFSTIRRAFGALPALGAIYLAGVTIAFMVMGGNQPMEFALLPQYLSIWLVTRYYPGPYRRWLWYSLGLLGGLAFFLKQPAIGVTVSIFLVACWQSVRSGERRFAGRLILYGLLGGATVAGVIVLYFAANGALSEFWAAAFSFNATYSGVATIRTRVISLIVGITPFVQTGMVLLGGLGFLFGFIKYFGDDNWLPGQRTLMALALVNLPLEFLLLNLSGRGFFHYFIPTIPVLSILCGYLLFLLVQSTPSLERSRFWAVTAAVGMLALFTWVSSHRYIELVRSNRSMGNAEVMEYITANSEPENSVLIYGAQPEYYFFAKRRSPTRYIYQFPLVAPRYVTEPMVVEFLEDIVREEPALIIVTNEGIIPWLEFPISTPAIEDAIRTVNDRYELAGRIHGWRVYRPRGEP